MLILGRDTMVFYDWAEPSIAIVAYEDRTSQETDWIQDRIKWFCEQVHAEVQGSFDVMVRWYRHESADDPTS